MPNLRAEERPFLLTEESSSIRTCLSVARRSGMVRERVGTFACCLHVRDGVSESPVVGAESAFLSGSRKKWLIRAWEDDAGCGKR